MTHATGTSSFGTPTESVATTGYHAQTLSSSEGSTLGTSGTTSVIGTTTQPTSQTPSPSESQPASTISTTSPGQSSFSTSEGATSVASTTTPYISQITTEEFCQHMEYIDRLIESNSVTTKPDEIPNKTDFIKNGANFVNTNPMVIMNMPSEGAVVRNAKVQSDNVDDIMVIFTSKSGGYVSPIRGNPTALSTDDFPKEKIVQLVIVFLGTTDDKSPKDVTLSVVTCAEGTITFITKGTTAETEKTSQAIEGGMTTTTVTTSGTVGTTRETEKTTEWTLEKTSVTAGSVEERAETTTGSVTTTQLTTVITAGTAKTTKETQETTSRSAEATEGTTGVTSQTAATVQKTEGATHETEKVTEGTLRTTLGAATSTEGTQQTTGEGIKTTEGTQRTSAGAAATTEGTQGTTPERAYETTSAATDILVTSPRSECTNMQDILPLGSMVFASVSINGISIEPAAIPTSLAVTNLPFVIQVTFKNPATLHEVSVINPSDSKISVIKVATDQTDDKFSTDSNAPTVTFENDIEYVEELTITLNSTKDNMLPENPVKLSILACLQNEFILTKAVIEENTEIVTLPSDTLSTSASSSLLKDITTPQFSTAPSNICQDDIALIPEQITSENILLVPRYSVEPRTPYNPIDVNPREIGVSFPSSDKAYIIIFPISPAAVIKSVRLPKTTNVDQMRVLFLDAQDKPIIAQPSDDVPLQITSKLEQSPTINVNLSEKVNAVNITLIHTSNNQPPENVTVEIVNCIEPSKTTSKATMTTSKTYITPATNYTSLTQPSDSPCKPKRKPPARVVIGECISQQYIQQESCAGHCSSYEELDPLSGDITEKECLCCAPDLTYTELIVMDCLNAITGQKEQRMSQIMRIQSCKCSMCLGTAIKPYSNDEKTYKTINNTNRSKIKTKTRRR
ncbi:unnamed protein product [Rotaria sordida]|uniref:CTCK domain-containing protein n=1 Tax=Rotaria sordida TaxID=392033 RepID=A0A819A685_9BILA|nr:unnamed protein product [Rotaria sordida]CAF3777181.1 unnamed protein product [Rotaria sordida]